MSQSINISVEIGDEKFSLVNPNDHSRIADSLAKPYVAYDLIKEGQVAEVAFLLGVFSSAQKSTVLRSPKMVSDIVEHDNKAGVWLKETIGSLDDADRAKVLATPGVLKSLIGNERQDGSLPSILVETPSHILSNVLASPTVRAELKTDSAEIFSSLQQDTDHLQVQNLSNSGTAMFFIRLGHGEQIVGYLESLPQKHISPMAVLSAETVKELADAGLAHRTLGLVQAEASLYEKSNLLSSDAVVEAWAQNGLGGKIMAMIGDIGKMPRGAEEQSKILTANGVGTALASAGYGEEIKKIANELPKSLRAPIEKAIYGTASKRPYRSQYSQRKTFRSGSPTPA
jgi:hypothetical protein